MRGEEAASIGWKLRQRRPAWIASGRSNRKRSNPVHQLETAPGRGVTSTLRRAGDVVDMQLAEPTCRLRERPIGSFRMKCSMVENTPLGRHIDGLGRRIGRAVRDSNTRSDAAFGVRNFRGRSSPHGCEMNTLTPPFARPTRRTLRTADIDRLANGFVRLAPARFTAATEPRARGLRRAIAYVSRRFQSGRDETDLFDGRTNAERRQPAESSPTQSVR